MTRVWICGAIGALMAATLAACGNTGGGAGNADAIGDDSCTHVVVATSSEKVNLMEDLGKAFANSPEAKALDTCATIYTINVASGDGARILSPGPTSWPLKDKRFWPTIWSPASTLWTDRVAAAGNADLVPDAKSFARTPVVLGVPQSMATALGYPQKPVSLAQVRDLIADPKGWGAVGKPLWGQFKIAKTNPNTSTSGLSIILMQSYAAANKKADLTTADVAGAADFSKTFESGAIHYGDTTGNVLTTLAQGSRNGDGSSYVSAVAVEETSIFNYNEGNPDSHTVQPGEKLTPPREKLVAVYPEGGSMFSDDPATVLGAPWVTAAQRTASKAFVKFLQTNMAQELLPKYGFRPVASGVDVSQYLNSDVGINPQLPAVELPKPSPDVVSAAIDQWETIRKPSAVLEVIDTSASMNEDAGNGKSRLTGAIEGASKTLGHFRGTDDVGVWAFTTGIQSDLGDGVVSVQPFGPLRGEKEQVVNNIADLAHAQQGGTPLYDSIAKAYDYMLKHAEPGRINAIVVLTDGQDTDSAMTLDSLLVKLNGSAKEGATASPVRIFTIGYGGDADQGVLKRIAKATGGQAFDASDATRIDQVFTSVINNF